MAYTHARYTTAGGRIVTVVADLPILASGYQCDGCFDQVIRITDVADMDSRGRAHAKRCTSRRPYKPTYWSFI